LRNKKLLVLSMIMAIQNNGGRFVKKMAHGEWMVLSNKEVFGWTIQALKCDKRQPLRPSIRSSIFKVAAATANRSNSSSTTNKKVTIDC
jgi:hypothetical protein